MNAQPHYDIDVKLAGDDGNAFGILGKVRRALHDAGATDAELAQYQDEATVGDYDNLLAVTQQWVHVT